jgi:hypothetical protein
MPKISSPSAHASTFTRDLVIILPNVGRASQIALFELGIDFIERQGDIINQVSEIAADGTISLRDWSKSDR